jgi:hypothetical protein
MALTMLALGPTAAGAQGGAVLDGSPLNIFADGLGGIQVRLDNTTAGLFHDPEEDPGRAGLEISQGEQYFPLQAGFDVAPSRVNIAPPAVTDLGGGTQVLRSAYAVGPSLKVSEALTYVTGSSAVDVHYDITNLSPAPVSIRAAEIGDLFVGANDSGNGVRSSGPPRFAGGRDAATGLVYGLQELTPWNAFQEGDFELVFDNFRSGLLNNAVDPEASDNAVGADYRLDNLAPGESRAIDVRWLLAAAPPPGTTGGGGSGSGAGGGSAQGELPPPVAGKTVNIKRARGVVKYKVPGAKTFVTLKDPVQVPMGTTFDTVKGRVTLFSAADLKGGVQDAWFYEGIFKVTQTRGAKPVTVLSMAGPKPSCTTARSSLASAAAAKKKQRKLWGDGKGKFRTNGRFSSATVRGTKWVVIDRCDGTLTRVVRGSVAVRDNVRKKTVIVRAGKQYLARKST